MGELDTAEDFLHYLKVKEAFPGSIVCEGEENLMGVYLHAGRKLPDDLHVLVASDGTWSNIRRKPEFIARKEDDRASHWWDKLVEQLIQDSEIDLERGSVLSDHELLVRVMAAENRLARRVLSVSCLDWLQQRQVGARNLQSPSGVGYVFGTYPKEWGREFREADLSARCLVARAPSTMNCSTVIGIGTEIYDPAGYSLTAVYLHMPNWTSEDDEIARRAQEKFGVMQTPRFRRVSIDEFPVRGNGMRTNAERNRAKRERRGRKR